MRPGAVWRPDGVNDGQVTFVVNRLQSIERRMQPEKPVKINSALIIAARWFRNRDLRPKPGVVLVAERNDHRDTICGATLKNSDHDWTIRSTSGIGLCQ